MLDLYIIIGNYSYFSKVTQDSILERERTHTFLFTVDRVQISWESGILRGIKNENERGVWQRYVLSIHFDLVLS